MNPDGEGAFLAHDGYGRLAANAMLCAMHRAEYFLLRLNPNPSRTFVEQNGGTVVRNAEVVDAVEAPAPVCPKRRRPMAQPKTKPGSRNGKQPGTCTTAPKRRGTRTISKDQRPPAPAPLPVPTNTPLIDTPLCPQIPILATSDSLPKPSTPESLTP